MKQELNKEPESEKLQEVSKKKTWNFRQLIDGNIFVQDSIKKQTLYILFIVFLSVIYIHNKYVTEGLLVEILQMQKQVKELRDRSVDYASELMSLSRESEVIKIIEAKNIGIKELKSPPYKIVVKKK
jgi:predicted alpha-1,6-mannanase (GH76 family)